MPNPDYAAEHEKALRANARNVLGLLEAKDKNLMQKLANFAERFGYELGDVIANVQNNMMFASQFAISPSRQNIYETTAARHIEALPFVENFKKLPTKALSVLGGAVIPKAELERLGGRSGAKTIDFSWITGKAEVYASHKYTKDEGGGQANQYEDLQHFIREARDSTRPNTVFIAIADGPFYAGKRLETLKGMTNGHTTFAVSIDELPELLTKLAQRA